MTLVLTLLSGMVYADIQQTNTTPPSLIAPSSSTLYPWSATDRATQSYPMEDMDTMPIQSTGTYNSHHPESHPIPLSPNDPNLPPPLNISP